MIRELALGVHRFDEIQRNTGAPRDILASRLRRLETAGVLEKRQYQERPARFGYHLTEAGGELRPILLSIAQWGDRWAAPPRVTTWVHTCGDEADLVHTCRCVRRGDHGLRPAGPLRGRSGVRTAERALFAAASAGKSGFDDDGPDR